MKQRKLYEAKRQLWAELVLSNINEYTAWNQRSGSVKSEAELEDEKEEHLENKYGIIGKCRGDVSGLCFDVRKSACETAWREKLAVLTGTALTEIFCRPSWRPYEGPSRARKLF